jgi:hypothetical protein
MMERLFAVMKIVANARPLIDRSQDGVVFKLDGSEIAELRAAWGRCRVFVDELIDDIEKR